MSQLKNIKYWKDNYARNGARDKEAVRQFMECEGREHVRSLSNELRNVKKGNIESEVLMMTVGKNREVQYESYPHWAELMLLWMAELKRTEGL